MRMRNSTAWRTARLQKSLAASKVAKPEIEASNERRAALARGAPTSWPWSPRQYYPFCCLSALYYLVMNPILITCFATSLLFVRGYVFPA
jgi:hypothetical protein